MKKRIITSILFLLSFAIVPISTADDHEEGTRGTRWNGLIQPTTIVTWTSEPCGIQWEGIDAFLNDEPLVEESVTSTPGLPEDNMKRYPCVVWVDSGFMEFISELYRFAYFTALIFWVIMIVLSGIILSMSGVTGDKSKEFAKKWIPKILLGITILVLIPFLLKTIAPFFFQ